MEARRAARFEARPDNSCRVRNNHESRRVVCQVGSAAAAGTSLISTRETEK